ncbi:hypothetical protein BSFA1_80580 (plasmid) [Burkholderia sp. SFA1]|nr:hypothetical protein BYI23_E001540 [Burkholderia sp. YI23]BBQ02930.1 hypothetical protein BSFA1_80580 [Burkholderia sp. SFA1]
MAELILTAEERAAATWFELPDEVVGMLTKYSAARMLEVCSQRDKVWQFSMYLMMIQYAVSCGIESVEHTVAEITVGDEALGSWRVRIERVRGGCE